MKAKKTNTKIKNILISNIYSWENKGDAAIVISMLKDIKSQFPNASISLSTIDLNDYGKYGDYKYVQNVLKIIENKQRPFSITLIFLILFLIRLQLFNLVYSRSGFKAYFLFGKKLRNKIKLYEKYDLIIACGGGYMLTESAKAIVNKYLFWQDYYIGWRLFNTPYLLYNQSIGPFHNKFHTQLVKKLLSHAKVIFCREELSYKRIRRIGLRNCILSADIAFHLDAIQSELLTEKYNFSDSLINVGITVRKWLNKKSQSRYEKEVAQFIKQLISSDDRIRFYFMPQVIFSANNDDDLQTANRIYNLLPDEYIQGKTHIIRDSLHPSSLKYLISKMNFFVGTRMHSNIFALSSNVKTIAIAYEPKTIGIMRMLGLKNYVIKMEKVTAVNLTRLFKKMENDQDYSYILKTNLKKVRKNAIKDLKGFL